MEEMDRKTIDELWVFAKFILIIIGVVAFGFVILNQGAELLYKAQLNEGACGLCIKENPTLSNNCINEIDPSYKWERHPNRDVPLEYEDLEQLANDWGEEL